MLCYLYMGVCITLLIFPGHSYDLKLDFINKVKDFLKNENTGLSSTCEQQLSLFMDALTVKETWAIRMYDAGVKVPPSGILEGNVLDLGSFDECVNIQHLKNDTNIFGKYCIGKTTIRFDSKQSEKLLPKKTEKVLPETKSRISPDDNQREVSIASCFPSACSAWEMQKVYDAINFDIFFDNKTCQTKNDRPNLSTGGIATISVYGVIVLLVVASTAYDVVIYYLEKKSYHSILTSFSLLTNGRTLIKTGSSPNEISCLHGLRVISTFWIILDHRYSIQFQHPVRNSFYFFNWLNSEGSMFMLSANLAVDTFLLLSGLLISYNFMRTATRGVKFNIFLHYIHRYIRLTPVIAVVMVFHMYLLIHVGSGPFWPSVIKDQLVHGCQMHWWKALLYIQNIFGREKPMCIPQTWYLSLDMQLFLVSPFLVVPLKRWPKLTLAITGCLTVMSMIACFLIGWFYELNAFMYGNHDFDKEIDYVWLYYFPIHTRAGPWLIGIILGYIVFENKEGRFRLVKNKIILVTLWINSIIILCLCVFAGHRLIKGQYRQVANSVHLALVRPVWAIAVGWIIFACINGRGGFINWFLSLPTFQVLSKLTYTLYIVHYPLIYLTTTQMRVTPLFNNSQAMYKFWGDLAIACLVSAILTLTIEFPFMTIDKVLLGKVQKKEG